jgi:hypothetical protein
VPFKFSTHLNLLKYLLKTARSNASLFIDLFPGLSFFLGSQKSIGLARAGLTISKDAYVFSIDGVLNKLGEFSKDGMLSLMFSKDLLKDIALFISFSLVPIPFSFVGDF